MPSAGDRDNFSGDVEFVAPTGGFTRGLLYAVTDTYGVSRETVVATAMGKLSVQGCVWATKTAGTGLTFLIGDKVYRNASTGAVTPAATGNALVGIATAAALAADTKAKIFLIGLPVTAS